MRLILRATFGTLSILAASIGGAWAAIPATSSVKPLWFSRYPGGKSSDAYTMVLSPDGSKAFVAGYVAPSIETSDYETVAYDAASGAELWAASYDGPAAGLDRVIAAVASPDGSTLYVTGTSDGQQYDSDWATIAYDTADGTQVWLTRYTGGPGVGNSPSAIGISPDGSTLYVTGETTIAYDAATGTQLWQSEIAPSSQAEALGVSPDGSLVYVGAEMYCPLSLSYDFLPVAYDAATGAKAWSAEYDGPGGLDDVPRALGVSPDGRTVYVTGGSVGAGSGDDYATIAYDTSDGSPRWVNRLTGPGARSDVPVDVGVAPDGSQVFVTGTVSTGNFREYLTLALDSATGQRQWASAGAQRELASGLVVGPDGTKVYVTGQQFDTVAYDARNGTRVWTFGSGITHATNAAALAIDPTGAYLYLAGSARPSGSSQARMATAALPG